MKIMFNLSKIPNFLLIVFILSIGISCKDQKSGKSKKNLNDQMDQLENDESFAGSDKRDDICKLLTEKDIQLVFDLSDTIEINQKKTRNAICTYDWEAPGKKFMNYSVSLNFARGGKRTKSQIDAAWQSQNKSVYKKHKPQKVSGVGDRATWSSLGGGQLRVAAKGYIFYVSHSVMVHPTEEKPDDTQGMIDKTSTLAKKVIERM